jgi:hypothetical protein
MTMPDPPVNINGTRAAAVVLHLFHVSMWCSGDSATRRLAHGRSRLRSTRRGCHVRAIGPAYNAVMSKEMTRSAARRFGRPLGACA